MGRKCVVLGSKSGYECNKDEDKENGTILHSFPMSSIMKRKWYLAIPRKDWEISANSVVCSLHFHNEDDLYGSLDTNAWRRKQREPVSSDIKKLKEDSIPTIFPNLPPHLTKSKPKCNAQMEQQARNGMSNNRRDMIKRLKIFSERQSCKFSRAFKEYKFHNFARKNTSDCYR